MRLRSLVAAAVSAALAIPFAARADEVLFKNGDRLSGTIVSASDGKLKLKSAVAGTVEISLSDVETFSSEKPLTIKLNDDTVVKQPVQTSEAGTVAVASQDEPQRGDTQPANRVAIDQIKSINAEVKWTGSVVAGMLLTRGNSDTDAFNLSFDATRRTDDDRINVNGQYLFGRQRDINTGEKSTSTDNWRVGGKYDYFFTPKFYGFASGGVEKDRIANLDIRLTPAVGAGYQWVEREDLNFFTEAGLAYVYEEFDPGATQENISLKLAYHLDGTIRDGLKAFHNMTFYPSIEDISDYYLLTDAGLRADLTDNFFTEFKVELRYDGTPAEGSSRDDLRYILGVGWSF